MALGTPAAAPPQAAGAPGAHRGLTPVAEAICGLPSLPDLWAWAAQQYGDALALVDRHRKPATTLTFSQLHQAIQTFAAGVGALGVRHGERCAALPWMAVFFSGAATEGQHEPARLCTNCIGCVQGALDNHSNRCYCACSSSEQPLGCQPAISPRPAGLPCLQRAVDVGWWPTPAS